MNKKIISRLDKLIIEAKQLPEDLYRESEFENYSNASTEEERGQMTKLQYDRKERKNVLIRKILPFFNAHIPEKKEYFNQLSSLTFRPKEGIYNSFHYQDNEAWRSDRKSLINLLEILKTEFEESKYSVKTKESIFSSRLFWAIVSTVGGLAYFLGTYITEIKSKELENKIIQVEKQNENLIEQNKKIKDSLERKIKELTKPTE